MLANFRVRLLILLAFWLITAVALALWISGSQRRELTLAAGPAGSETYLFARTIAEVLEDIDDGPRIMVLETGGSKENMMLLERGQVDLAMVQADTEMPEAALGLARLFPDAYHLVVTVESGVRQVSELGGKRVAIPPRSSAEHQSFWFLADHYGLQPKDLTALPVSSEAAIFALQHGEVDALFKVRSPGNPAISRLIRSGSVELVPIRQAEALALKQPALRNGVIPEGSYRGYPPLPGENLLTAALDRLLVAHADLTPGTVYRFTRALFESRSDLVHRYPLAGFMTSLDEDANSAIPAHPGARRYFDREKPSLLQQNARLASALLYTAVIIGSGLFALRARWLRSRRLRMGDFNARLMAIAGSARGNDDFESLLANKHQLMDILQEVVSDLDQDRVSQDEFEHFSFTWQAVDALLRDQILLIKRDGVVEERLAEKRLGATVNG